LSINITSTNHITLPKKEGFTTIELIVVIILIGILAVTIIPKMQSTGGYEEITYQNETVTKLRSIQLRTMQDTSGSQCHDVLVTGDKLGIPDDSCTSFLDNNLNSTTIVKIIEHAVNFQYAGGSTTFSFDSLGRPVNCSSPCQISIVGQEQTLIVAINAQGYIYAAN
jgi:MSHA pilin protein MshC